MNLAATQKIVAGRGLATVDIDIVYSEQSRAHKNSFAGTLVPAGTGLRTAALEDAFQT